MESEKNKKIFNIAMVAIIILIIVGGIFAVGSVKGWFGSEDTVIADADKVVGIVSVERSGVSYELKNGDDLLVNDKIKVNDKASVVIKSGKNTYELAEGSLAVINEPKEEKFAMKLDAGETFVTLNDGSKFGEIIGNDGTVITADGTVFSVNVHEGSLGINVFEGDVRAAKSGKDVTAKAGQAISIVGKELNVVELKVESLNGFNINKLLETKKHEICFSADELNKVLDDRVAASEEALQNAEDESGNTSGNSENGDKNNSGSNSNSGSGNTVSNSNSGSNGGSSSNAGSNSGTGSNSGSNSDSDNKPSNGPICTIEIRCDTILNNMANLTPGKEGYVPSNGIILRTTTVSFKDGETVYDVLKRVCSNKGIQMEASFTPMYNSYYVEGINHLYEFDCGDQSGWMYKVNGWFPNYGCSAYYVEDGDTIVWTYSCNGLGADVGGGM